MSKRSVGKRLRVRFLVFAMITLLALFGHLERSAAGAPKKVSPDCTYGGKKLYGRVQIVSAFPDLRVQAVSAFPDLRVQVVDSFPGSCGRWQIVDSFPDLKVQFVG